MANKTCTASDVSLIKRSIIDFHAHVLPRADHGSSSLETSLFQLDAARCYGVSKIIATPHFYPNSHALDLFLKRRENAYRTLMGTWCDSMPDIRLGAEVLLCENLNKLPGLEELCIYGTRTLLLELPFVSFEDSYVSTVDKIMAMDIDIILAHADKYPKENIEKLRMLGARLQLNADSLATFRKKKHLYDWLEDGAVVALGSDIHGKDAKSYKKFLRALDKIPSTAIKTISKYSEELWNNSKEYQL